MTTTAILIKSAVNYHNRYGGICPKCHLSNALVKSSHPWRDSEKVRYHKCDCGYSFTSIETEQEINTPVVKKPQKEPKPNKKQQSYNKSGKRRKKRGKKKSK